MLCLHTRYSSKHAMPLAESHPASYTLTQTSSLFSYLTDNTSCNDYANRPDYWLHVRWPVRKSHWWLTMLYHFMNGDWLFISIPFKCVCACVCVHPSMIGIPQSVLVCVTVSVLCGNVIQYESVCMCVCGSRLVSANCISTLWQ